MQKGFTFSRIIGCHNYFGIILVIAIPNIIKVIDRARLDVFESQKQLIINAAKHYVTSGHQITWEDDTAVVYLKDLKDVNILENPLKDPRGGYFDNRKPKGTKVIITKIGNKMAYLSHSKYGKMGEIYKNNNALYITGCSGENVSSPASSECSYPYDNIIGMKASTTGNIYGIYDTSGGAYEYISFRITLINNSD